MSEENGKVQSEDAEAARHSHEVVTLSTGRVFDGVAASRRVTYVNTSDVVLQARRVGDLIVIGLGARPTRPGAGHGYVDGRSIRITGGDAVYFAGLLMALAHETSK